MRLERNQFKYKSNHRAIIPSFQIATPVTAAANPSSGMATLYHRIMVINSFKLFENQSMANAVDE